ncbi:uncharacterized protein LOC129580571 [Sitodiplosis mosellana]|uniref:uncharacterized protein LOC129580571 n=1 Tax=Sitodiplosis mosellana TaxID=263140 RepID=UPI0024439F04|nr:uncharacterized protein LOC129580571 [Sitodiplosis mosellana]XP_055327117.1 uncharacterized protein LOC129580571 [Sitodiplosis mosellana]
MSGATSKLNAIQRLFRFTGMEKGMGSLFGCVIVGFNIGALIDRSDTNSMVIFRDKSALYGGRVKEGDKPSWPSQEVYWT